MKRRTLDFVKKKFGNQLIIGAEVGVSTGAHALDILQNMPNVKLLYLIDPYLINSVWTPPTKKECDTYKKEAIEKKMAPFSNRTRWIHKEFEVCTVEDVPDPLDFIYIDGNHSYENVKKDIELAAQLVKEGGVIGGHDAGAAGVTKAYTEYCERTNIECFVAENKSLTHPWQGSDWWFINSLPGKCRP